MEIQDTQKIFSWGRLSYPIEKVLNLKEVSSSELNKQETYICYGKGRSYGDSALGEQVILTEQHNQILDFDVNTGILKCQAGLTLEKIIDEFLNQGWFLAVTPGTKFITVGGAISADVHGKNQHIAGSFSEHLISFKIQLSKGEIEVCSKDTNSELFKAVCGGMGLLGIILEAEIQLQRVPSSYMNTKRIRTANLRETMKMLSSSNKSSYSVAWIDCNQKGKNLGRSVISLAEHAESQGYEWSAKNKLNLPFYFSGLLINKWFIRLFNALYYYKNSTTSKNLLVDIDQYFYPLDGITNWNKLYGKGGFLQYQFVLPFDKAHEGLSKILNKISQYPSGATLGVLKLFGQGNNNYLSFPTEGYTLAVDFKANKDLENFLETLDQVVIQYGGRFYLAKDSRVKKEYFEAGYPKLKKFKELRQAYNAKEKFQSFQSRRLGL